MGKAGIGIHYNTKQVENDGTPLEGQMDPHLGVTEGCKEEEKLYPFIITILVVVVSSYRICVLYFPTMWLLLIRYMSYICLSTFNNSYEALPSEVDTL